MVKLLLTICLALIATSGCISRRTSAPETKLAFRLTGNRSSSDALSISTEAGRTIVDVHSQSGIGRAELSPNNSIWPRTLILRFHLRGLESLSINNGHFKISTSVLSRSPYRQICELLPGEGGKSVPLKRDSPYWIPLEIVNKKQPDARVIPLENGYFEITLPDVLLDEMPQTLYIQWIDFWRG